ncbi:MAG: proteobacterial dedicated sortase system response regulator [Gammaproteobacteria bacterium]|nr:proteobacterial dedicated sortase system response regulator [Gammaproteobacteria bacterium]
MTRQVALVEDEAAIRDNYSDALQRQGFVVRSYADRITAIESFRRELPDMAIIDIGLGDDYEGGFELCRELRSLSPALPIMFLTARDSDLDTISGLRLGADDYLTKNISVAQVIARVLALFRRIDIQQSDVAADDVHRVGDLTIDVNCMQVEWKSEKIDFTLTEFWMLNSIAKIPGHVKSRGQLMQDANIFVDDGTVTSHIKRVRRKFEQIDAEFDCIETIYGMGYRWNKK